MKLTQEEIKQIIPHRDPMLLVSTVEEMVPGESIVTTFWVDPQREIFKGHFPAEPVLPGVYSVECMAQTADILLLSTERYAGKVPLFLGINNVRFLRKILPGDTLEIHAKMASAPRASGSPTLWRSCGARRSTSSSGARIPLSLLPPRWRPLMW